MVSEGGNGKAKTVNENCKGRLTVCLCVCVCIFVFWEVRHSHLKGLKIQTEGNFWTSAVWEVGFACMTESCLSVCLCMHMC